MDFFSSRIGLAAIVAATLGVFIVGLLINRSWLLAELEDERRQVAILQAAVREQNAAVVSWQEAGARDKAERDARAVRALAPRPKPNLKTVEELNAWFALR